MDSCGTHAISEGSPDLSPTVVVTGATGFVGTALLDRLRVNHSDARVIALSSARPTGLDLSAHGADEELARRVSVETPRDAVLIHLAAEVDFVSASAAAKNIAMALNVATWARNVGIGFATLASSVSVYAEAPTTTTGSACSPSSPYGIGKLVAEDVWKALLEPRQQAIVRLAGVWGLQARPTLFWNKLLLAAARGSRGEPPLVLARRRSGRNYIAVADAARCLLEVALHRQSGVFIAAGPETVNTGEFVDALAMLPGSRLTIEDSDDGGFDEMLFQPTGALLSLLTPFDQALNDVWSHRPRWGQ